jgi:hypothetical protein
LTKCQEPCPDDPELKCRLGLVPPHAWHFGGYGDESRTWANEGYQAPPDEPEDHSTTSKLFRMAKRLRSTR